jgi:DNA-nicking Smr family endonuclease
MGLNASAAEFTPGQGHSAIPKTEPVSNVLEYEEEYQVDEEAFIAVLKENFPGFSSSSLRDLFRQCSGSLSDTIDALWSIESEVEGQLTAVSMHREDRVVRPNCQIQSEEEFPSLGETRVPTAMAPGIFGGNFAAKVKSSAGVRTQAQTRQAWQEGGSYSEPKDSGRAAPIWSASESYTRFETGDVMAKEYAEERSDARDHARVRNQCFQQATLAYLSGDRKLAKELGEKGRWHNMMMKKAHEAASQSLFTKRNAAALGPNVSAGDVPVIDLHGLHVAEAEKILGKVLDEYRTRQIDKVHVIVGVGQHGKVPSRLPQAIKKYLAGAGLRYSEIYAGMLEVCLF